MENKFDKLQTLREFSELLTQIGTAAQAVYDDVAWDIFDGLEYQSLDIIGDYNGSVCEQVGKALRDLHDTLADIRELGSKIEDAGDSVHRMAEEIDLYVEEDGDEEEDEDEDELEDEAA